MRHTPLLGALFFCIAGIFALTAQMAAAQTTAPAVVISQVYGGGGNAGAIYTHDFIELFNQGQRPVSLHGWSVQYASARGGSWQKTELSGTIQPGRYYLIQEAQGRRGVRPLPAPDAVGAIPMSFRSGKVALLSTTQLLAHGVTCPHGAALVDLVGFGRADCFAGQAAAPGLNNRTAAQRGANGCADTGNNRDDFLAGEPAPRNRVASPSPCTAPVTQTPPPSARNRVAPTTPAPASRSSMPTMAFLGAFAIPPLFLLSTPDVTPRRSLPTPSPVISNSTHVVISQVYGGGGNAGAIYTHDFVELYNAGPVTVSLAGWSLQYASARGTTWLVTVLTGTVAPGAYYLIQQAQGAGGTLALPRADAVGETMMSSSRGKVALVRGLDSLAGACPGGELIVDFVGYGSANCFEGGGPGAKTSNSRSLHRIGKGAQDTDDNRTDFVTAPPQPDKRR